MLGNHPSQIQRDRGFPTHKPWAAGQHHHGGDKGPSLLFTPSLPTAAWALPVCGPCCTPALLAPHGRGQRTVLSPSLTPCESTAGIPPTFAPQQPLPPHAALLLSPISGPALSQCYHHVLQPHRPHSSSCPADAHCHPLPHLQSHQPVLASLPCLVPSLSPSSSLSLLPLLIISLHPHVPISSRSLCPSPLTRRWGGGLPAAGR